jgi:threonine/homoserine/homoserine lactone efflux protein
MLGTINLTAFILSGIGLALYPGPDTMYIVSRSLSQGRRAGVLSAFGISTGGLCHTLLAGIGLSSLLLSSPRLFTYCKIAGSLYLAYLGARFLINSKKGGIESASYVSNLSGYQIYRQGLLTNLLNPKVALFFISFLPQFIDPVNNLGFISFIFLGSIFLVIGTIWCLFLALFSSKISSVIINNDKYYFFFEKISGLILIGLGFALYFD